MRRSWLSCCSISRLMFKERSGRIHKALHKAEVVGQKVGTFFHDEHAAGIQLQALFILFAVIVVRCAARE